MRLSHFFLRLIYFKAAVLMGNIISMDMQEIADGSPSWVDGRLRSMGLKPAYGSGCLSRVISLKSGISMVLQDFSIHGNGRIRLSRDEANLPFIGFGSYFSGVMHISYAKPRIPLGHGFSNIEFTEYEPALFMEVKGNTPIQSLIVCVNPSHFEALTGKSCHDLIETLSVVDYNSTRKTRPARFKQLDFAQKLCTSQAIAALRDTPNDLLLLEAKAMELVALQLKQLECLSGLSPKKGVSPDIAKISYACEILKKEMAAPPGARELANRVGMNYNKLVQGFKKTMGIAPFEYLRTIRLEKAYDLIAGHHCNVTEAAFSVGYSSLSHFTKSFQKEFGINPKAHAQKNN